MGSKAFAWTAAMFLFLTSTAQARVFHLKEQSFGTYIEGTGGNSALGDSAFHHSGLSFENKEDYSLSGEFGLMFLASRTWIRLGIQLIRPHAIAGAQAADSSGSVLYRVDNSVLAWGPVATFEFPLKIGESSRLFVLGGLGYMKVTVKNDYHLTSAGNAVYHVADYAEEASAYSLMGQGGLGWEAALADNATFTLTTGYRGLVATSLKHERANATIDGAINAGDTWKDADGDRSLDLSGFWVGLGLRFYWNW
jgi:hypothetical protein